jgi:hypothetical protein
MTASSVAVMNRGRIRNDGNFDLLLYIHYPACTVKL